MAQCQDAGSDAGSLRFRRRRTVSALLRCGDRPRIRSARHEPRRWRRRIATSANRASVQSSCSPKAIHAAKLTGVHRPNQEYFDELLVERLLGCRLILGKAARHAAVHQAVRLRKLICLVELPPLFRIAFLVTKEPQQKLHLPVPEQPDQDRARALAPGFVSRILDVFQEQFVGLCERPA